MAKLQQQGNSVAVRMYRQGHGDCFLLALPRKDGNEPVYVLIDCGLSPGPNTSLATSNLSRALWITLRMPRATISTS